MAFTSSLMLTCQWYENCNSLDSLAGGTNYAQLKAN